VKTMLRKPDIISVAEKLGLEIKKDLGAYVSLPCPFHEETLPSFCIYKDTQRFFCYGCKEQGDVIDLVMKIKDINFVQAVDYLEITYQKGKRIARKNGILDHIIEEERAGVDVKKKYGNELIDNLLIKELRRLADGR
jgi:DNA primase